MVFSWSAVAVTEVDEKLIFHKANTLETRGPGVFRGPLAPAALLKVKKYSVPAGPLLPFHCRMPFQ